MSNYRNGVEPDCINECPTHGDEFVWFNLTCLACEADADPRRAAELADIGIVSPTAKQGSPL